MRNILIIFIGICFISCKKETLYAPPCIGDCNTEFAIHYSGDIINKSPNGYYEIEFKGLNYFQIKGDISELSPEYVINGVPLVEVNYDSDYWILIDTIRFTTPQYSYLGWFSNNNFNSPIPIGNITYTMVDLTENHQPLNVVGYQISKYFCYDCQYAPTLLGTHSKYNYKPTQNIILDNEMIGDTINLFVETTFNTDLGETEVIKNNFSIIIK